MWHSNFENDGVNFMIHRKTGLHFKVDRLSTSWNPSRDEDPNERYCPNCSDCRVDEIDVRNDYLLSTE